MIIVKHGEVAVTGRMAILRAEFCCLCRSLFEIYSKELGEKRAKEMLNKDVELAILTDEELEAQIDKMETKHIVSAVSNIIKELLENE